MVARAGELATNQNLGMVNVFLEICPLVGFPSYSGYCSCY